MSLILAQFGFNFVGMCGACDQKKHLFRNPLKPDYEIKVLMKRGIIEIYKGKEKLKVLKENTLVSELEML